MWFSRLLPAEIGRVIMNARTSTSKIGGSGALLQEAVQIRVRFFAGLKDRVGSELVQLELPQGATVVQLKEKLLASYPSLRSAISRLVFAVDNRYLKAEEELPKDAEVFCFPPVSGG
ncbi:MAG: MoaD/ThiS family protein [Thermoguttaceae bacterium]|nr:MoaD/ThiS family protein [Thermoguttaceae bacterium]MDW8078677.1 MoaD/ThiS family protein [Thermoguttaceae bacterium]